MNNEQVINSSVPSTDRYTNIPSLGHTQVLPTEVIVQAATQVIPSTNNSPQQIVPVEQIFKPHEVKQQVVQQPYQAGARFVRGRFDLHLVHGAELFDVLRRQCVLCACQAQGEAQHEDSQHDLLRRRGGRYRGDRFGARRSYRLFSDNVRRSHSMECI